MARVTKVEREWSLKLAQAIAEVLNSAPTISVADTMKIIGLALYVYMVQVKQDLDAEEED